MAGLVRPPITSTLSKVRSELSIDYFTEEELSAFHIKDISINSIIIPKTNYSFNNEGVTWLENIPDSGEEYIIEYYKPFTLEDILYIPDQSNKSIEHPLYSSLGTLNDYSSNPYHWG